MAQAVFRFYAGLNDFLPPEWRQVAFAYPLARRAAIKDAIEALGVPHPEVAFILVNGEPVGFDHIVRDGERIAVYPVFQSLEISDRLRASPRPPADLRFVLDAHLGRLARYLRLCGFDTLYANDFRDGELAAISAREDRVLLTRDIPLLKRRLITHGHYLRSDHAERQLAEVLHRFQLHDRVAPFRRCARCNARLRDADKTEVAARLEPLTRRYYDTFRVCTGCGQVYWYGSHARRIERLIERARQGGAPAPDGPCCGGG